jgi:protein PhnA
MTLDSRLRERASACELCGAEDGLIVHEIEPSPGPSPETAALICEDCEANLGDPNAQPARWHGLKQAAWSEHRAVQVLAYRILKRLGDRWATDLAGELYLHDETKAWADADPLADAKIDDADEVRVVDANGVELKGGDNVVLVKDLEVKGGGFTAKRGTLVKGIQLSDDPKYVEGKVNGIQIVLVAAYLKKANG